MANSRLQDIYHHLKANKFRVYFPAQKLGECTAPYVVVKDMEGTQFLDYSSTVQYYDILCYIPKEQFSTIEPFVDSVKQAMKGLSPMIKPTYTQTGSYYDDTVKAHMVSIQYKNYRKII